MSEHKHDWRHWSTEYGLSVRFPGPHFALRWCPDCGLTQQRFPGKAWRRMEGLKTPVIQLEPTPNGGEGITTPREDETHGSQTV